jgi:GNAT superfamily N-acetyltransferase
MSVLARLPVDRQLTGMTLGAALLQDDVKHAAGVSVNAGIRALLVHALSERGRQFYLHQGFGAWPRHPMT